MGSRKDKILALYILLSCCVFLCLAEDQAAPVIEQADAAHISTNNQEVNKTNGQTIKQITVTQANTNEPTPKAQQIITTPQKQAQKSIPTPSPPQLAETNSSTSKPKTQEALVVSHLDEPIITLNQKLPTLELSKEAVSPPSTGSENTNIKIEPLTQPIATPDTSNPQLLAHQTQRQGEIQEQKHEEEVQQQNSLLKPWIVEQMQYMDEFMDEIITESFQFVLDPETFFQFRWNPSKNKKLLITVSVFTVMEGGEITVMRDNDYTEHINILVRNEGQPYITGVGEVYIFRKFSINFDTDYKYFKFVSKMHGSVLVMVDLEKLNQLVPIEGIAQDQHFSQAEGKLQVIKNEVISGEKMREHTYKYEWGYLENQYAHEGKLLGLTGFELVVIMSCAVMQLYFIKSLLDNRAVV